MVLLLINYFVYLVQVGEKIMLFAKLMHKICMRCCKVAGHAGYKTRPDR